MDPARHAMLVALVVFIVIGGSSGVANPAPALLWTSHPTFADETLVVWGSGLDKTSTVSIGRAGKGPRDVPGRASLPCPEPRL